MGSLLSQLRAIALIAFLCGTAVSAQPSAKNEADAHYKAGVAALNDGQLDAAKRELDAAAALAPNDSMVQYELAILNQKKGETYQALESLWEALRLGLPPEMQKLGEGLFRELIEEINAFGKSPTEVAETITSRIEKAYGGRLWIDKTIVVYRDPSVNCAEFEQMAMFGGLDPRTVDIQEWSESDVRPGGYYVTAECQMGIGGCVTLSAEAVGDRRCPQANGPATRTVVFAMRAGSAEDAVVLKQAFQQLLRLTDMIH